MKKKKTMREIFSGYDYFCLRCKKKLEGNEIIEDCYEDSFGRRPFIESLCCGAPVVSRRKKG